MSQVRIIGAKPPNSVKAPLYTRDVPVERTPVGKISDSAAGATPTKLATNKHTMACTTIRVGNVGSAFNHRNSGSTAMNSSPALKPKLTRRPIRSDQDPNHTQPMTKGILPISDAPKAWAALKPNVSARCTYVGR